MKTILKTIGLLTAVSSAQLAPAQYGTAVQMKKVQPPTDIYYARVPTGKTYYVYDGKGKKVGEFKSGQKTPKATSCAMIKCPSTFGKDVVCWQCMGLTAK
jgi:hypothetical protein